MAEFQATRAAREKAEVFKNKGEYQKVVRARALQAMAIVAEEKERLLREESVTPLAGTQNKLLRRIKVNAR